MPDKRLQRTREAYPKPTKINDVAGVYQWLTFFNVDSPYKCRLKLKIVKVEPTPEGLVIEVE